VSRAAGAAGRTAARPPLIRRLVPRDPREPHRTVSPLELLTDLCFVVAISAAARELHHAVGADQPVGGMLGFVMAFFAIWWSWLNFTWFGSAYDNDDVVYRLFTILQIVGVLVLAAGIPSVFEGHFGVVVIGYVVMRIGLVLQWLRAARHDPAHRRTCLRYALGIVLVQLAWLSFPWLGLLDALRLPAFMLFAVAELAVPLWAERAGSTTWHPHHIAERHGLLFIIVLGETILSATTAISAAFADPEARAGVIVVGTSSVLIVFSCWWLYFSRPAGESLDQGRERNPWTAFGWGFGHYVIFASAAAVGAGLTVRVDYWTHHSDASGLLTAAAVTVPVTVLLGSIWLIQLCRRDRPRTATTFAAAALLVLVGTWTPVPELVAGVVTAALLVMEIRRAAAP